MQKKMGLASGYDEIEKLELMVKEQIKKVKEKYMDALKDYSEIGKAYCDLGKKHLKLKKQFQEKLDRIAKEVKK